MGDEAVETLKLIWGEMKALNSRIDKTNEKLDQTRVELSGTRVELSSRIDMVSSRVDLVSSRIEALEGRIETENDALRRAIVESQMRVASEVVAVAGLMRDVKDRLETMSLDRHRLEDVERRVSVLESRSH